MRFRKRPVVIDAIRYNGLNGDKVSAFGGAAVAVFHDCFVVTTREGRMRGDVGDWLIRGVAGEFYPCKPEIFDATYDPVGLRERVSYVRITRSSPDVITETVDVTDEINALLNSRKEKP